MKAQIHPKYVEATVTCGCGNTFTTMSTRAQIKVEICAACHPFYTGTQKFVDTAGRVQKFLDRFAWGDDKADEASKKKSASAKKPKAKRILPKKTIGKRGKRKLEPEEPPVEEAPPLVAPRPPARAPKAAPAAAPAPPADTTAAPAPKAPPAPPADTTAAPAPPADTTADA